MRVGNFECQIAQSQIGRYLGGEGLSNEAVRQLNQHIAECADCQQVLNERKAALLGMLGAAPAQAVVHAEDPGPRQTLRDRLQEQLAKAQANVAPAPAEPDPVPPVERKPAAPAKATLTKPMLYSLALAAVMIAMSYLAKNPTSILGEKASADLPAATLPATPPPSTGSQAEEASTGTVHAPAPGEPDAPSSQNPPMESQPIEDSEPQPATNSIEPVATRPSPRVTVRKTPLRQNPPPVRAETPARKTNGIRVYDASGAPLNLGERK